MTPYESFKKDCAEEIAQQGADLELSKMTGEWIRRANSRKYSYHFEWLGRPIIQYPQDIVAMQQIVWSVKPDLIIETGIAHGGSVIFSASMLELNASCGGPPDAEVVAVDIDMRPHNRDAIEGHPMSRRISILQGSSIAPDIVDRIKRKSAGKRSVLVCLDSNHTHEHVLAELEAYAPLTSVGSYCIVFDTIIEDLPPFPDRPWGPTNNPKTAVREYLKSHPEFEVDKQMDNRLLISVAPDGYLRRVA